MSALEGARAGWSSGDVRFQVPMRDMPYGEPEVRIPRYRLWEAYENGNIFDFLNGTSSTIKEKERLYKFLRPTVNDIKSAARLYTAYTFRGAIDTQEFKTGALPLTFDNTRLLTPLQQIIKWSNLDQFLPASTHDACVYGDTAGWIVSDPARGRVRIELVDPARVKYRELDEAGNVKAAVLEWEEEERPLIERYKPTLSGMQLLRTKTFLKTIKVTKEWFETYKDGEPFAYYTDGDGSPVTRWPNRYGFVPLKLAYFEPGKDGWGQNFFAGGLARMYDELASLGSLVDDSIKNVVVPLLQATGIAANQRITVSRESKDSMAIVYMPNAEARLEPVGNVLDIGAASAHYQQAVSNFRKALFILALQEIRDKGDNISGVAIKNLYGDAISSIEGLQKNMFPFVVSLLQMATTIGAIDGYDGFSGFNEQSYERGEMDMRVQESSIIADELSHGERVDKIVTIAPLPEGSKRKALSEMGYSDSDIEDILAQDKAEQEEKTRQAMRGFAESVFEDDDDEGLEDEDTADTEEAETETADTRTAVAA